MFMERTICSCHDQWLPWSFVTLYPFSWPLMQPAHVLPLQRWRVTRGRCQVGSISCARFTLAFCNNILSTRSVPQIAEQLLVQEIRISRTHAQWWSLLGRVQWNSCTMVELAWPGTVELQVIECKSTWFPYSVKGPSGDNKQWSAWAPTPAQSHKRRLNNF